MTEQIPTIYKGLAGVVVETTAISKVVPETNSLTYRGYAVQDLAANCSFEEVAHLLWYGELPTPEQLELLCLRERSEEHTSELQSLMRISYAVLCLKKKNIIQQTNTYHNVKY